MASASEFQDEIQILTREFSKHQPSDILQFCANHFLRRLEAQRSEHRLSEPHQKAAAVAESSFPGTNPFTGGSPFSQPSSRGMQSVREEDEDDRLGDIDPADPKAPSSSSPGDAAAKAPPPAASSAFGNFSGKLNALDGANLPTDYNFNRRTSVSAESMNPTAASGDDWKPPVHKKSPDQQARLKTAVEKNFLFNHLDDDQTHTVLEALVEKAIPAKGMRVITQGDEGDYFYIVENGQFEIYVSPTGKVEPGADGLGKQVATAGPGGSFGELALMYNAPRAASVVSTEASTLWALDRITFRRILMDSALSRRKMYESFLSEVPLLEPLTEYERAKIADALNMQKYPAGHTIIKEGDPGESFFILETGNAEVFKSGTEGPVSKYKRGDYFGELALLNDQPRAASVISSTEVKLATLGKEGFQRLLGPVEDIMRRNDPRKQAAEDQGDPLSTAK